MVLQFPKVRAQRRAHQDARPALARPKVRCAPDHAALEACHAEILAITRTASALAGAAEKKSPGRGGPEDRGLNRAWAARKRAQ
jgi:hypothetical protein